MKIDEKTALNKLYATLLTIGFIGLVAAFIYACVVVEYFIVVVFIIVISIATMVFLYGVIRGLWEVIYESFNDKA